MSDLLGYTREDANRLYELLRRINDLRVNERLQPPVVPDSSYIDSPMAPEVYVMKVLETLSYAHTEQEDVTIITSTGTGTDILGTGTDDILIPGWGVCQVLYLAEDPTFFNPGKFRKIDGNDSVRVLNITEREIQHGSHVLAIRTKGGEYVAIAEVRPEEPGSAFAGCHIDIDQDFEISVDTKSLAGVGLKEDKFGTGTGTSSSSCSFLSVAFDCHLDVTDNNELYVNIRSLAGGGLREATGTGTGSGSCTFLAVATDCNLEVDSRGRLKVDVEALAGGGLHETGTGSCTFLTIATRCHLTIDDKGNLRVTPLSLAGVGLKEDENTGTSTSTGTCSFISIAYDCHLAINGNNEVYVDARSLAGIGLIGTGTGSCDVLSVGYACNLAINEHNELVVDIDSLAGPGLNTTGTGSCEFLTIQTGCHLHLDGDKIVVTPSTLAGDGLDIGGTGSCQQLEVFTGCHLKIDESGRLRVDMSTLAGEGLALGTSSCEDLNILRGCHLEIDEEGRISVTPSTLAGDGLEAAGTGECQKIKAKLGCHLVIGDNKEIKVVVDSLLDAPLYKVASACDRIGLRYGCHLSLDGQNRLVVNTAGLAGPGLVEFAAGSCNSLAVNPGCGIQIAGDAVAVDLFDLIDGNGGLAIIAEEATTGTGVGCDILTVNPDCGLEINEDGKLQVRMGDLAGIVEDSGLVVQTYDEGCDSLAIDTDCAGTAVEIADQIADLVVTGGQITLIVNRVRITNCYNAAGILVRRNSDDGEIVEFSVDTCELYCDTGTGTGTVACQYYCLRHIFTQVKSCLCLTSEQLAEMTAPIGGGWEYVGGPYGTPSQCAADCPGADPEGWYCLTVPFFEEPGCYLATQAEVDEAVENGATYHSGPHETEELCLTACAGASGEDCETAIEIAQDDVQGPINLAPGEEKWFLITEAPSTAIAVTVMHDPADEAGQNTAWFTCPIGGAPDEVWTGDGCHDIVVPASGLVYIRVLNQDPFIADSFTLVYLLGGCP